MSISCFLGIDVSTAGSTQPDPAHLEAYRKTYSLYRELYPALKPGFDKIVSA